MTYRVSFIARDGIKLFPRKICPLSSDDLSLFPNSKSFEKRLFHSFIEIYIISRSNTFIIYSSIICIRCNLTFIDYRLIINLSYAFFVTLNNYSKFHFHSQIIGKIRKQIEIAPIDPHILFIPWRAKLAAESRVAKRDITRSIYRLGSDLQARRSQCPSDYATQYRFLEKNLRKWGVICLNDPSSLLISNFFPVRVLSSLFY